MKAIFISPVTSDALIYRRVDCLATNGVIPLVLYFQRDYYKGSESRHRTIKLGELAHASPLARLWTYIRALYAIAKQSKGSAFVYAFGTDLAILALTSRFFTRSDYKVVCEVQDIHSLLVSNGLAASVYQWVDSYCVQRANMVVVTSEDYVTEYYSTRFDVRALNYFVLENKVDAEQFPKLRPISRKMESTLVIGYFGVIRCKASWKFLTSFVTQQAGSVLLYVRGKVLGIDSFQADVDACEWIEFGGEYVSPDDLSEMYNRIDISWIAHAHGRANSLWARSNRFYEAMYFKVPVISQLETVDSRFVAAENIGIEINMHEQACTAEAINSINASKIDLWRQNIRALPKSIYQLSDDHQRLLARIESS